MEEVKGESTMGHQRAPRATRVAVRGDRDGSCCLRACFSTLLILSVSLAFPLGTLVVFAQDAPPTAKSPTALPLAEQRSIVLGNQSATPIYMDTGRLAAAENNAYWTPSASQFVVVRSKLETLNGGTPCSTSRVRLTMNDGAEHPLAHPDQNRHNRICWRILTRTDTLASPGPS